MSILLSPLKIKTISFKNRIAIPPMCQYSSIDGFPNHWHFIHYGSRVVGGAGLIIQEATAVSPEGRISYQDMGIWSDEHAQQLKPIVDFIHSYNCVAGIQLAHAGRKASCEIPSNGGHQLETGPNSWQPWAPSSVQFYETKNSLRVMTKEDILLVISQFKKAAQRALHTGYKLIEVHAAHGYLIHEFLSPLSNLRTDEYGGSFENRIRFLLEIIDAVNEVWPSNLPLFVRISATDWTEGGWDIDQSVKLSAILKAKGVDLIDTSSGGNIPHAKIPVQPGYQVPFASRIKKETGIMSGAVGLITTATQAENILQNEDADIIFFGRKSLADPYLPLHLAQEMGIDMEWPVQYERRSK